jgi:hypothetical protein
VTDQAILIELDDDTEGHATLPRYVEPDDADWLEDRLRRDSGRTNFRIKLSDPDDTEGHALSGARTVRVLVEDDDDTEGHAITVHFPTPAEADAFRRRLMLTGVLVGTLALGAAGGAGLSALQSDDGVAGTAGTAGSVATQVGPMDVHEAPAFGINAAAQVGPLDAHEAPAFASSVATDANRDVGIMDGSGAAAAAQAGPLDAHEAPAFEGTTLSAADQAYADRLAGQAAATQVGPLDAHEAPAFGSGATGDDDVSEPNAFGGPTPR